MQRSGPRPVVPTEGVLAHMGRSARRVPQSIGPSRRHFRLSALGWAPSDLLELICGSLPRAIRSRACTVVTYWGCYVPVSAILLARAKAFAQIELHLILPIVLATQTHS